MQKESDLFSPHPLFQRPLLLSYVLLHRMLLSTKGVRATGGGHKNHMPTKLGARNIINPENDFKKT